MKREHAQDLFSQAYEGELSGEQQAQFDQLLASDPQVQADYASFRRLMRVADSAFSGARSPDLVRGVRGRMGQPRRGFRGDRLGQVRSSGRIKPLLLALLTVSLLGLLWAMYLAVHALIDTP